MIVKKSNLVQALRCAIAYRERYEKRVLHYTTDSALLAGWKEALKDLLSGSGEDFRVEV